MRAKEEDVDKECGEWCMLAADVIVSTQILNEHPRRLNCWAGHDHDGPHMSEGWSWLDGQIWRTSQAEARADMLRCRDK
jgi:hypothetical protein